MLGAVAGCSFSVAGAAGRLARGRRGRGYRLDGDAARTYVPAFEVRYPGQAAGGRAGRRGMCIRISSSCFRR